MTPHERIVRVIHWKRPGAAFALAGDQVQPYTAANGDACAGLQWHSPEIPQPSAGDIALWLTEYAAVEGDLHASADVDVKALLAIAYATVHQATGAAPSALERQQLLNKAIAYRKAMASS
ncbi:MAG TPA: hypothetical protein VNJ02_10525 [Vicinamibacterales bacterium]|nr:hypothetical protein [Vicinamibacterales bacterium]